MSDDTVESLLRDIRDEMRTSNARSERIVELWEEQREANKATEANRATEHVEVMAHFESRKVIEGLELEILKRRAEQERRWDKPDTAIGELRASVESLRGEIQKP